MYGQGKPPPLSKRIFNKYDKDGGGSIACSEFNSMCYELGYKLSKEELALAIKKLDADGSGSVEYGEFKKWWSSDDRFGKLQLDEQELETLNTASNYFKFFDKDGTGVLERDEFKNTHKSLVENKLTTLDFESCLKDLDTDNSGSVSFNEYVDWLIKLGSLKVKVM
mmetsp:Transcript_30101/g.33624  ORF Transcript_30101/g.33624 Transcript_30101/m.33624 type:complete len:166 (-) Transcript_30101:68-565(-)